MSFCYLGPKAIEVILTSLEHPITELGAYRHVAKRILVIVTLFFKSRHKPLTKLLLACYDSGAFSQTSEGALFLPSVNREEKPPHSRWLFFLYIGDGVISLTTIVRWLYAAVVEPVWAR